MPAGEIEGPVCPRCGATRGFRPVEVEEDNQAGLFLLLGGLLPYLLSRGAHNKQKVICERCHYVFAPREASSSVVGWIVAGLALIMVALYIYQSWW